MKIHIDEFEKLSSPEPPSPLHVQRNLAQRIIGRRGLKFVQMKSLVFIDKGEIIMK